MDSAIEAKASEVHLVENRQWSLPSGARLPITETLAGNMVVDIGGGGGHH